MGSQLANRSARIAFGAIAALGLLLSQSAVKAQPSATRRDAAVIVDGVVLEVFRSPRQGRVDVLVQIEVRRSELGNRGPEGARVTSPAPGEPVYVHIGPGGDVRIPAELSEVRAYLSPRARGGWEGASADWFEPTSAPPIPRGENDLPPAANDAPPGPKTDATGRGKRVNAELGLTSEAIEVQGHPALRVLAVERSGPARKAGLEVGDVIAGVDGKPLSGASQLDELARQGRPLSLIVVDINSGKAVQVEITPTASGPNTSPSPPTDPGTTPSPSAPTRSLGISTESVNIGGRTALKVSAVTPNSPAAKAGLEVGDVLVGANGAAITGPEQLAAVLRKSGSTLTLLVRDVRTGKDTPVEVAFGGSSRIPDLPGGRGNATGTTAPGSKADRLGAVTELSFYDVELALKVTEVEPGGPAARAGLQPGTIIVKADGKAMLHPNDLVEACRKAANDIRLTIADPRAGRTADVNVDLRGR